MYTDSNERGSRYHSHVGTPSAILTRNTEVLY